MYKSYSEKISEIIESHAEDMVEKFARYISDQYEDMNADDLIKDFKKSEKSSSTSKKEEKKSSSSSKKENSKKEDSPKNSSKGKSLKQKIAEAKKEDKYYNVKSGRKTKRTKQQENKGLVFYEDYNICGEKDSDKLKDALKELKKDDESEKEDDKKSTKSKENRRFVENDQGNHEHEETGLVINPKTKKVFGKQDKDGDVLALTDEDIKACEKYRFKYTELTQEEIDTNIMELTGFHQGSEKEEKSELNLN